ncbi:hypothetical protein K7X08_019252 [Anisodus acutangulus]|uniref:Uncharacterized protein n=1 Tax=Anisodus acutangulus TaxID=402998 RepID=A0A9Q1RPV0_9SOLA|nr:hypothetical protein K7X08_019252 [Anisodus acutangulus]
MSLCTPLSQIPWNGVVFFFDSGKTIFFFAQKSLSRCVTKLFGWWTLKPRPKEQKELAHLYERRKFPYPGDEKAMEEFVAKGGMIGTTIGPKGVIESDKDSYNYQKVLQDKKVDQEALKLWMRMGNEVISELQEKGFDVE